MLSCCQTYYKETQIRACIGNPRPEQESIKGTHAQETPAYQRRPTTLHEGQGILLWFRIAYTCPTTASLCNNICRFFTQHICMLSMRSHESLLLHASQCTLFTHGLCRLLTRLKRGRVPETTKEARPTRRLFEPATHFGSPVAWSGPWVCRYT